MSQLTDFEMDKVWTEEEVEEYIFELDLDLQDKFNKFMVFKSEDKILIELNNDCLEDCLEEIYDDLQ